MVNVSLGKIKFNFRGDYNGSTQYYIDDIVKFGNNTYICIADSIGNEPVVLNGIMNETYWDRFQEGQSWKGEWVANTEYHIGDIVRYGKSSYISNRRHNDDEPLVNAYASWSVFKRGATRTNDRRCAMLPNDQPFNWNRNIPNNIPDSCKKPYYNQYCSHSPNYYNVNWVDARGGIHCQGQSQNYSNGSTNRNRSMSIVIDPPFHPKYWDDKKKMNTNFGQGSSSHDPADMPRVVQYINTYDSHIILYSNGTVACGGYGGHGQMGTGHASSAAYGLEMPDFGDAKIIKVATSAIGSTDSTRHNMALDDEGNVFTWGYNGYGQLGIGSDNGKTIGYGSGDTSNSYNPIKLDWEFVFEGAKIVDIFSTGGSYGSSYALDENGYIWAWGYNGYGQLGYPTSSGYASVSYSRRPVKLPIDFSVYGGIEKIQVSGYGSYGSIIVLDGQGYLWFAGYNPSGYIRGDGNTANTGTGGSLQRITTMGATSVPGNIVNVWLFDSNHPNVFVRLANGETWGWGRNDYYQLTTGNITAQTTPVKINGFDNAAKITMGGSGNYNTFIGLDQDGYAYVSGYNGQGSNSFGYTSYTSEHRQMPSGTGTYWWQPAYVPNTKQGKLRDVDQQGYSSGINALWLFDDGTIRGNGHSSNYTQGPHNTNRYTMTSIWGAE